MWHMRIPISVMPLTFDFRPQSNTNGSMAKRIPNPNKCGGDFVACGLRDLARFWKKELRSSGITSTILRIGTCQYFRSTEVKLYRISKRLVFRWIAIPWLQKMTNSYAHGFNTMQRRNRRKILPDGLPDTMFENPENVNAHDFAVRLYYYRGFCILTSLCIYRLPLRTRYLRKLNTDGLHRLTPSSSLFLWIVANISHLFMLKSAVQQLTLVHSGRFTMHYVIGWIQMPFVALRSILTKRTNLRAQMEVSPFITSAPVNSA
jgi:hypothetical protein